MIRVVVVDDHPLVRTGVVAMLEDDPEMDVVGTAGGVDSAVDVINRQMPDIVLLDVHLGTGGLGLEILKWLPSMSPKTRVVMLTVDDNHEVVVRAIKLGARGYVLKSASAEYVRSAVRQVAAGFTHLDPSVSEALFEEAVSNYTDRVALDLSPREIDVLRLAAAGMTNDSIGTQLGIATETVKTHLSRAFLRLEARDRAHAVAIAIRRGVV